jgi:hypothetical protein
MIDAVDEELELEIDDSRLAGLLEENTEYKLSHATPSDVGSPRSARSPWQQGAMPR